MPRRLVFWSGNSRCLNYLQADRSGRQTNVRTWNSVKKVVSKAAFEVSSAPQLHAKRWLVGKDWCWEGLAAGGEGDGRGWDGWMASRTRWAWVWVNSRSWWWTGRPGVLWFMGSQRVGHNWTTELNWCYHYKRKKGTVFSIDFLTMGLQVNWILQNKLIQWSQCTWKSTYYLVIHGL